jgi:hypothetical protein
VATRPRAEPKPIIFREPEARTLVMPWYLHLWRRRYGTRAARRGRLGGVGRSLTLNPDAPTATGEWRGAVYGRLAWPPGNVLRTMKDQRCRR